MAIYSSENNNGRPSGRFSSQFINKVILYSLAGFYDGAVPISQYMMNYSFLYALLLCNLISDFGCLHSP